MSEQDDKQRGRVIGSLHGHPLVLQSDYQALEADYKKLDADYQAMGLEVSILRPYAGKIIELEAEAFRAKQTRDTALAQWNGLLETYLELQAEIVELRARIATSEGQHSRHPGDALRAALQHCGVKTDGEGNAYFDCIALSKLAPLLTAKPTVPAQVSEGQEPIFWYRPTCNGEMYEGPVHTSSVGGKMLRDEKPDEWLPLYGKTTVPAQSVPKDVFHKLELACIASCKCMTKTPDPQYHEEFCNYRLIKEAQALLQEVGK